MTLPTPLRQAQPGERWVVRHRLDDGSAGSLADAGRRPRDDEGRQEPDDPDDHFVPPPPPRVALATPPRLLAWLGLFGVPLLTLVAIVVGASFPQWLSVLFMAWFVGGFVFLVASMRSGSTAARIRRSSASGSCGRSGRPGPSGQRRRTSPRWAG